MGEEKLPEVSGEEGSSPYTSSAVCCSSDTSSPTYRGSDHDNGPKDGGTSRPADVLPQAAQNRAACPLERQPARLHPEVRPLWIRPPTLLRTARPTIWTCCGTYQEHAERHSNGSLHLRQFAGGLTRFCGPTRFWAGPALCRVCRMQCVGEHAMSHPCRASVAPLERMLSLRHDGRTLAGTLAARHMKRS